MKVLPTGDFLAAHGENITFTVTRIGTPCNASFDSQGWASCGPLKGPDGHSKIQTCTASADKNNQSSCTIKIDFRNDENGTFDPNDKYKVTITGGSGGSFTDTFSPEPVLNCQTYTFRVE